MRNARCSIIYSSLCLIFLLAASVQATVFSNAGQDQLTQIETLISQAKEQGMRHLQLGDKKAKSRSKKGLEQAEKLLKAKLKQQKNCEKCYELYAETHFFRTVFGFAKSYKKSLEKIENGLKLFPDNSRLSMFKGYALYNTGKFNHALRPLNHYLLVSTDGPAMKEQARKMQVYCQQVFLAYWNRQSNFYQSKESRIMVYNPRTAMMEVRFQITPRFELNLGSQGFAALTAKAPRINDPEIQSYLEELVNRLVSKSPGSSFSYRVTVLNSPEVNAATPPGHIIVYLGLLGFAENEAELASVLSHELAHNYGHHQARAVIKKYLAQSVAVGVVNAVNPQGQFNQMLARLVAGLGVDFFMRAYSRFEEKEADHYGAHILYNAGYNPTAASIVFLRMYKRNPKQPIKFFSTHPPTPDRINYLTDYLEQFPLDKEMQMDSRAFQNIKTRVETLLPVQAKLPGKGLIPPLE